MKTIRTSIPVTLLFVSLMIMTACSNREWVQTEMGYKKGNKESSVLILDIHSLVGNDKKVRIYNPDGTEYIQISEPIIFNGKEYDLLNDDQLLKNFMEIRVFDTEYNLAFFDCLGVKDNLFQVMIGDSIKFVEMKGASTKLISLEEHILRIFPKITRFNPVFMEPTMKSDTVPNASFYTFNSRKINGEWLYIETDTLYTNESEMLKGWVKWRDRDKLLIEFAYTY